MKLVRKSENWYNLYDGEIGIGSTYEELQQPYKLSITNCDEIFGVVDVEKLAEEFVNDLQVASETVNRAVKLGYEEGFNKAMELNKDKLFTLEDMRTMMVIGAACEREKGDFTFEFESYTNHLLTEVEVEIEMVCEIGCVYFVFNGEKSMCCGNKVPKLDENGCLILKKK